tara:strand:+ start:209 stop:433 length:225 start_codon:yes stop_codon:yes gene_type:complete
MGFHKRYISEESILSNYQSSGIEGLKRYFSADALIINGEWAQDLSSKIQEAMGDDDWNNLEIIIKDRIKYVESV